MAEAALAAEGGTTEVAETTPKGASAETTPEEQETAAHPAEEQEPEADGSGDEDPERAVAQETAREEVEGAEPSEDPIQRALRDTKSWATKVSQENAELRKKLQAQTANAQGLASSPEIRDLLAKSQKVAQEYPEMAPLVTLMQRTFGSLRAAEEAAQQAHLQATVATVHPEVGKLRSDPVFLNWVRAQPPSIQYALTQSTDPRDAVMAISLYKAQMGQPRSLEQKRAQEAKVKADAKAKAAAGPSPKAAAPKAKASYTREQIAKMSVEEYRKNEAAIDAAMRRGEIR